MVCILRIAKEDLLGPGTERQGRLGGNCPGFTKMRCTKELIKAEPSKQTPPPTPPNENGHVIVL